MFVLTIFAPIINLNCNPKSNLGILDLYREAIADLTLRVTTQIFEFARLEKQELHDWMRRSRYRHHTFIEMQGCLVWLRIVFVCHTWDDHLISNWAPCKNGFNCNSHPFFHGLTLPITELFDWTLRAIRRWVSVAPSALCTVLGTSAVSYWAPCDACHRGLVVDGTSHACLVVKKSAIHGDVAVMWWRCYFLLRFNGDKEWMRVWMGCHDFIATSLESWWGLGEASSQGKALAASGSHACIAPGAHSCIASGACCN